MKNINRITEHKVFQFSIYVKAIFGLIESITGLILLIAGSRSMTRAVQWVFGNELLEDPHDAMGNFFMNLANNLSLRMHMFVALYMIVHGIAHIMIVLALLYRKRWAYGIAGIMLSLFVLYQIYQIIHQIIHANTFSILLTILTIIDVIIISLLRIEYKRIPKEK